MGLERLWRTSVAAAPPDDAADDAGSFFVEMWYVVKLGAPMTLSAVFGYLPVVIMLVMVRTVDEPGATGGAGMGVMYQNLLGVSTIIGAGSGLGPLAAQAFGAEEHGRVGDLKAMFSGGQEL